MDNALGEFLRARRELVTPADVGLPPGTGLRRVPGLRREEVALLAGISAEYYLRLEQGRDRTPSAQVVAAIAGVLRLDGEAAAHLKALAQPRRQGPRQQAGPAGPADPGIRNPPGHVPPGILALLETINVPGFVVNRYNDVLAANALARALSPHMAPGVNRLIALFTDPAAREYHPDWAENTAGVVAHLRAEIGADTGDERMRELIDTLSRGSARFRELWARHDVRRAGGGPGVIRHPQLGDLELRREKLTVAGADGLQLVLYHGPAEMLAALTAVSLPIAAV